MVKLEVPEAHAVLLAYARSQPANLNEIHAGFQQWLSADENRVLCPHLRLESRRRPLESAPQTKQAFERWLSGPEVQNFLCTLLQNSNPPVSLLRKDLLEFAMNDIGFPRVGYLRRRLCATVERLYGTSVAAVTQRYDTKKSFNRVLDLYLCSERDVRDFAYDQHIPFGKKSLAELDCVFERHALPALSEIVR